MMHLLLLSLLASALITLGTANNFGPPCMRERFRYRSRCRGVGSSEEATTTPEPGSPSEFAKTGYYDRLFLKMNQYGYDDGYWRYPTLGYNPNLPADGPYRVFRYGNY